MQSFEKILQMVESAIKEGILDYEIDPSKYEDDADSFAGKEPGARNPSNKDETESSMAAVKACKRPWWVCQPYVRPLLKEALEKGSLTMSKKDRRKLEEEGTVVNKKKDGLRGEKEIDEEKEKLVDESSKNGRADRREKVDEADGLDREEVARESMVCG